MILMRIMHLIIAAAPAESLGLAQRSGAGLPADHRALWVFIHQLDLPDKHIHPTVHNVQSDLHTLTHCGRVKEWSMLLNSTTHLSPNSNLAGLQAKNYISPPMHFDAGLNRRSALRFM